MERCITAHMEEVIGNIVPGLRMIGFSTEGSCAGHSETAVLFRIRNRMRFAVFSCIRFCFAKNLIRIRTPNIQSFCCISADLSSRKVAVKFTDGSFQNVLVSNTKPLNHYTQDLSLFFPSRSSSKNRKPTATNAADRIVIHVRTPETPSRF